MLDAVASLVIDLSDQKLYAYNEGGNLMYAAFVSTGKASSPTPAGEFIVGTKYQRTDLVGDDYRISLPYVMCLSGGDLTPDRYCIHPQPNNYEPLGSPYSHGCIRTSIDTARWLFNRLALNTPVSVIP